MSVDKSLNNQRDTNKVKEEKLKNSIAEIFKLSPQAKDNSSSKEVAPTVSKPDENGKKS